MNKHVSDDPVSIPPITLGRYFLVLLDQLGQTEELFKWNDFELLALEESKAKEAFFKSIKSTVTIRTDFTGLFSGFERQSNDSKLVSQLEDKFPGMTSDIKLACNEIVCGQAFSDTHLWYIRSIGASAVFNCTQLLSMIDATALTFLYALSRGDACRGSLALGCGTDVLGVFSKGHPEIYGPVLAEAHELETKTAKYPRVVVSDSVIAYLNGRFTDDLPQDKSSYEFLNQVYENSYIDQIREMIYTDDDGVFAVDYAGEQAALKLRPVIDNHSQNSVELYLQASEFAKGEWNRFSKARDKPVLADRYAKLYRYLDLRKEYWQ